MYEFICNAFFLFAVIVCVHRNNAAYSAAFGVLFGISIAFNLVKWFIKRSLNFRKVK